MRPFQKVLIELKDLVANHKPGQTLTPPPSLPFVTVRGHKMAYVSGGLAHSEDKPAIIFIHGFGGFFMDWPRVMAPLSKHTRVYALDLPGWGFSERNENSNSLEDDVAAVQGFVNALGIKRFILCGISYGAGVAWASAAMKMPGLERIVLLNPMAPNPMNFILSPVYHAIFALNLSRATAVIGHKVMRKAQYKSICRENLLNERLLDTFYLDLAYLVAKQPKMPFILNAHARGAYDTDWTEWERRLSELETPCSILQGMNDRVFSYESGNHLYELIPHSELIEIQDCGHAMVFDQHQKVADVLVQALARCEERREPLVRLQSS